MTRFAITLRPIDAADEPFLFALYASTREEELSRVEWSEADRQAFLRQQFGAQHNYYQRQFPDARFDLILDGGRPIGRLYVQQRADELRLIDIALVPECRGYGIGTSLLQDLQAQARERGTAVRIHVEKFNPALRLYRRLGFRELEDRGVYLLLEWRAQPSSSGAT